MSADPNCSICQKPTNGSGITNGHGLDHEECYRAKYPERFVCQCADPGETMCQLHGSRGVIDHLRDMLSRAKELQLGAETQTAAAIHQREVTELGMSSLVAERSAFIAEVQRQEKALQAIAGGSLQKLWELVKTIRSHQVGQGGMIQLRTKDWHQLLDLVRDLRP